MIKKFLNEFLMLLVLICCFSAKVDAQDVQVRAKLDQTTIRIGDQTKLHLSIEQPAKGKVNFPALTDTLTAKILIVGTSKPDTIADAQDATRITVTKSLTITSFDAGSYSIPAFTFHAAQGDLNTNSLALSVATVKVDTTKAIYDIKQPLAVSYSFMDWLKDNWQWIVFPLLTLLAVVYLIWYLRKRARNKPVKQVIVPAIPVHTLALTKLKELQDKKLWQQGEVKQYYSELSDVIREYLERRYVIKTYEKTSDEIFAALKHKEMTPEDWNMLRQLLTTADLVKFAKEKPLPVENEHNMDNAVGFVRNTQEIPQAAAKPERGSESGDA